MRTKSVKPKKTIFGQVNGEDQTCELTLRITNEEGLEVGESIMLIFKRTPMFDPGEIETNIDAVVRNRFRMWVCSECDARVARAIQPGVIPGNPRAKPCPLCVPPSE